MSLFLLLCLAFSTAQAARDNDGDGYPAAEDCDDTNPDVYPGATETCDGVDQDCDGEIDEGATSIWYGDDDGDGFGNEGVTAEDLDSFLKALWDAHPSGRLLTSVSTETGPGCE